MRGYEIAVRDEVRALHEDALVLDLHNDLLTKLAHSRYDIGKRHAPQAYYNPLRLDLDVPRLRAGGVSGLGCLVFTGYRLARQRRIGWEFAALDRVLARYPDDLLLATTPADLRRAKAEGKVGLFLGIESADGVRAPDDLVPLHARGVRFFGAAWQHDTHAVKSSRTRGPDRGLSETGRALVRACNRLGILVDVSHASRRGVWDMHELSTVPVFASHAGAAGVKRHYRNLDDDQLRAIGRAGGVVGVIFCTYFLGGVFATLERLADHIEHVADVAGEDAVALGSDMDGFVPLPRGLRDVADLPRLTEVLWRRGFGERRLRKLLGENWLRYFALAQPQE
ncbi:MAG TPA: dipeptidase [Polyangia bacterium]|jgi:membrane dipeptidase